MLIIGLGNEFRGDDSFGINVVRSLMKTHAHLGEYLIEQGDSSRLIDNWIGKNVIIIDAVSSEVLEVGTLCISHSMEDIIKNQNMLFSTHGLDLGHVLQLASQLKKKPRSVYFIGVVGKKWGIGDNASAEVIRAMLGVKTRVAIHVHAMDMMDMESVNYWV